MKIFFTILFFVLFSNLNATRYYIDQLNGDDSHAGTSLATAWKTHTKFNSFSFVDYDTVYIVGIDTSSVTLRVRTNNLRVLGYTAGAEITGLKQAGLTSLGSNLYAANLTDAASNLNLVVINNSPRVKARYPNNSYLRYNDTTSTQTVLNTSLTGTPNYTGFEVVVRDAMFIIDNRRVSSQSTGALTLNTALTYTPNLGGNGYFFQNDSTLLDSNYEWCYYSNGRFKTYLSSAVNVYYSTLDTLIRVIKARGVIIDGLTLTGANKIAVQYDTSNGNTLSNFAINYVGKNGISAQKCDTLLIKNGSLQNCLNNGAMLRDTGGNHQANLCNVLDWNNVTTTNVGTYPGMGMSDNGAYIAIYHVGFHSKIRNSSFRNVGFNPIYIVGQFDSVYNNTYDSFCVVKNDGAAIYTWIDGVGGGPVWPRDWDSGMYWGNNIALHGIGDQSGCNPASIYYGAGASGFYTDLNANNIKIEHNTGGYGRGNILSIGTGAHNDTIRYNTFYNNQDRVRDLLGSNTTTYGTLINANIYYLGDSSHTEILDYYKGVNAASITQDSNYITGFGVNNLYTQQNEVYSFAQYVAALGYDAHGGTNPTTARSRIATFISNASTNADSIVTLNDTYTDVHGVLYFSWMKIDPRAGVVLFPNTALFTKTRYSFTIH